MCNNYKISNKLHLLFTVSIVDNFKTLSTSCIEDTDLEKISIFHEDSVIQRMYFNFQFLKQ